MNGQEIDETAIRPAIFGSLSCHGGVSIHGPTRIWLPGADVILRFSRRFLRVYLRQWKRIWNRLPVSWRVSPLGRAFGMHVHALVRFDSERKQYFGTFFQRNRAEMELMRRLLGHKGSSLKIAVLACSKGAEVYSIMWAIRSARPDLRVCMHAVDISQEILEFAQKGIYSLKSLDDPRSDFGEGALKQVEVTFNTCRDQNAPIFERMTVQEIAAMGDVEDDQVRIKSWLREGIVWVRGDAGDPELNERIGPQDIVVANRFLCHMVPAAAEKCLRNVARLVAPGGYLFVSGIDLEVRTRVARSMAWKPVTELVKEVHEGDSSLRRGWPLEYWGLEPFCEHRADWKIRYSSVFQIGNTSSRFPRDA
jgi:chemotaxis methyl-accepting protein methylase